MTKVDFFHLTAGELITNQVGSHIRPMIKRPRLNGEAFTNMLGSTVLHRPFLLPFAPKSLTHTAVSMATESPITATVQLLMRWPALDGPLSNHWRILGPMQRRSFLPYVCFPP